MPPFDVISGSARNPQAAKDLAAALVEHNLTGTLYIGYPILATAEGFVSIDGLLCSLEHGVFVFDLLGANGSGLDLSAIGARQDELHSAVFAKLFKSRGLRPKRGSISVQIGVVTVAPESSATLGNDGLKVAGLDDVMSIVSDAPAISVDQLQAVNAAIERVSTLKPQAKRTQVSREDSRGAKIRQIEKEIANLDTWQKRAAIESPEGPQRIRGLAGSGKTIALALKATYLHAQHPDLDIALTFHTRSLYQQFESLVRRFSFEAIEDEPDWDRLRILHSWGSSYTAGIYSTIALEHGAEVRDFAYGKKNFGFNSAFAGVCAELLDAVKPAPQQLFDVVLIDEAQDLPREFVELCYLVTREPKRVVFAYDELQNLSRQTMAPVRELFGQNALGRPRVPELRPDSTPREDIVLPVCYRNTPWALTIAHALGFGIYRDDGLVQFFDEANLWDDVGYEVVTGELRPECQVKLRRRRDSYPTYFGDVLESNDAVLAMGFNNAEDQAEWIATEVSTNIGTDELRHRDILIILPDPLTQRADAAPIMDALAEREIPSHLVGVTHSVDEIFKDDSIALSGIFRAKGNEAPMVYVAHCEYGVRPGVELIRRRNTLFTAITRSRAWVRLCGVGSSMEPVRREIDKVVENSYQLEFIVPTEKEQTQMRRINRDMPPDEKRKITSIETGLRELIDRIESGDLPVDAISPELLERLAAMRNR